MPRVNVSDMKYSSRILVVCLVVVAFAVASATAAAPETRWRYPAVDRVVAFADVHGAYEELTDLLKATDVVDDDLAWAAGRARARAGACEEGWGMFFSDVFSSRWAQHSNFSFVRDFGSTGRLRYSSRLVQWITAREPFRGGCAISRLIHRFW